MKIVNNSNESEVVVCLDYASLLENQEVLRELVKYHAYTERVLLCLVQLATKGEVIWDDEDGDQPWRSYWMGPGEAFEKLRLAIANCANDTTRKLIDDLRTERDKMAERIQEQQSEGRKKDSRIRQLEMELHEIRKGNYQFDS